VGQQVGPATWNAVLQEMFDDLLRGGPRGESYWAQQLAFGPVLVHALRLRYRHGLPDAEEARLLAPCVRLAYAAMGALPELPGGDPTALRLLALRQARAAAWGRRDTLRRLLGRLAVQPEEALAPVPSRMARHYPLLGFRPNERLAG
jgi:hypothetical protein